MIFTINSTIYGQNTSNYVSPLQTGHYMPGYLSVRDFANPAPVSGLIALDYNVYQYGNKFYGSDGDEVKKIGAVDLNSEVDGYFNAPFLIYVSKKKLLGATYIGGISVPYIGVSTNLAYSRIGNITGNEQSGNVSGKVSGFSDLNILPIYLSWSKPTYDITAGYMFYAPTGKFELGGDDNTGLGYWSHVFQTFGYWYPQKINGEASKALAIMFGASYELTGDIKDSNVNPGDRFSLDYGIEQYLNDKFSVGLYGGNNWQISEDKGSQVYWDDSVKDRLGVVGLQLGYWLWSNRLQAIGKLGFSYGAVQRYQQNSVQVNLIFSTQALTGNKKANTPVTN
ncbi:transporter [Xanthomarina sp. GH4-25]|uniref:SphA family protein n=1 Tax=Xanthomarina sp. GH4-25 TaxID=3349335 RepID=UPI0038784385